jgi:hypothetical protein
MTRLKDSSSRWLCRICYENPTVQPAEPVVCLPSEPTNQALHPPFSPDLNPIETVHREQDKHLEAFILSVRSKAKAVQSKAEAKMRDIWQSKTFDQYVAKYCNLKAFDNLRIKVLQVEGHNTFQDQ